ncbi:MAG: GC-type dockerin domain-anchored protein [Planctomycetota bacterium]
MKQLACLMLTATACHGADVLIVSAGAPTTDNALVTALANQGHNATIGPNYWEFDAQFDLSPFDVVYIQGNGNWTQSDMPVDAQSMMLDFAQDGGGIIFSEWVVWMVGARNVFQVLASAMPVQINTAFRTTADITFTLNTPEPFLTDNLPNSFTMPLTSFSGTETFLQPLEDATVFYDSDWVSGTDTGAAVVGWDICGGRVVNFSTTVGEAQINDPNFQQLFGNMVTWVTRSQIDNACLADTAPPCGALNFFDISTYIARFNASDPAADTNNDGTLNFFDIALYIQLFNAGCP